MKERQGNPSTGDSVNRDESTRADHVSNCGNYLVDNDTITNDEALAAYQTFSSAEDTKYLVVQVIEFL